MKIPTKIGYFFYKCEYRKNTIQFAINQLQIYTGIYYYLIMQKKNNNLKFGFYLFQTLNWLQSLVEQCFFIYLYNSMFSQISILFTIKSDRLDGMFTPMFCVSFSYFFSLQTIRYCRYNINKNGKMCICISFI